MGRYKMGPQGGYYDANDSGPDQFTPQAGQQYPGMPAPQQTAPTGPDLGPGVPQFPDFPQLPGPHQGPWMPPDMPGYDPNQPPKEMQPWDGPPIYTGGYNPNGPMYGKPGWGGGAPETPQGGQGGRMVYSPSAHESSWVSDESLAESQRLANEYARTGVMPEMPKAPWPWVGQQNQTNGGGIWDAIQKQQGGGSLSSLVGQQATANGNLTANGSKWGGLGLGSLGSLAGFKK